MNENKWIIAVLNERNSINLYPRMGEHPEDHRWTWIASNLARLMSVSKADIDFTVPETDNLTIEAAEAAVIRINELLTGLEKRNLLQARKAWVERFNAGIDSDIDDDDDDDDDDDEYKY